ncbi:hypothetical protein JHK82_050610 [Glycine max]|nr:hypothetical protein JHK82_050610 [Glycine max]
MKVYHGESEIEHETSLATCLAMIGFSPSGLQKSSLKLLCHHGTHVSKANTNGNDVDVTPEFSPLKTVQFGNPSQDTVDPRDGTLLTQEMEALEEDYGDGNGKNESRQFIEGLMDLE